MMQMRSKATEFPTDPFWVVLVFYVVGLADLPYGYYTITRLVTCLVAIWLIWKLHSQGAAGGPLTWLLAGIAVLYNPIFPIYLYSKLLWVILNAITLAVFWSAIRFGQQEHSEGTRGDGEVRGN
ncbi:DUF6804 family protein [Thioalkalivibrio sp. XN8]|uniref:DUF6804 family protein n=1 Tax=Thioalkalivibrio sp. XN8 TaxID=2712863 RepID=UPI0013EBDD60|nr:DUF6804 family protein [Thioalkalivibrio sp. XN8]NGP53579.1 hypothetical protein [Thioalkalivibrio sp. XN8]